MAYLAALAAGLASQSPGGVGVFEATLLALLPEVPAGEVLAAALGYRLAYHAAPAATALVLLIAERPPGPCPLAPAAGADLHRALAGAPQAEWGLARQGASVLLSRNGAEGWLTPEAGRWLVALGLPLACPDLTALGAAASARGLTPLIYKTDGRTALLARRAGWRALRPGDEAVLDLASWSPDRPACRGLRRKLRAAAGAGVEVALVPALPCGPTSRPCKAPGRRRTGASGASPWAASTRRCCGNNGSCWPGMGAASSLSPASMRPRASGPLTSCATARRPTAPCTPSWPPPPEPRGRRARAACPSPRSPRGPLDVVRRALGRPLRGGCGIGRFKRSFGPRLAPRFAAAPSMGGLALGLAGVAWAIHRPPPLPQIEFEPDSAPCDAPPRRA